MNIMMAKKACEYALLDHGIHLLTYTEASTDAVDGLAEHLFRIAGEPDQGDNRRILIDNSQVDTQPLKYTMDRMREIMPQLNADTPSRVALLYTNHLLLNMIKTLLNSLPTRNMKWQIFDKNEREQAIQWLLSD